MYLKMSRKRFVLKWSVSTVLCMILITLLDGCITDDREMCPSPDNLTLLFRVEAGVSEVEKYSSVDVLLYDGDGLFVDRKRLTRSELSVYPGVHFTVTPGEYLALAWANASSESHFSGLTPGESLLKNGYIEMTGTGDTLYYAPAKINPYKGEAALRAEETTDDQYAPYRVFVPKGGGEVTKELFFTRAYRSVTIFLKGLENLSGGVEALGQIRVEAHNLSTRYDFLYNTLDFERNHIRAFAVAVTPDGSMPSARFYSAYGPIKEDISFTITNLPGEQSSVMIFLREYLMRNPPASFDDIDVLVEFLRGFGGKVEVSITLPDWSGHPVTPII
jgi:hypothetical protein